MRKLKRSILYAIFMLVLLAGILFLIFPLRGENTENEQMAVVASLTPETTEEIPAVEETADAEQTSAETAAAESETGSSAEEEEAPDETTLMFAGDVLFAYGFCERYDAGGIEGIIDAGLLEELTDADIFMVNNEFPFSTRGTPAEDKQYTFRCDPSYVTALSGMGVDIVTLANNHTLDYGRDALSDTFAALDSAGILYVGAGETAERAYELQIIEKNGKKFGFLAASRVIPVADWNVDNAAPGMLTAYDDTKLVELITEAKTRCDFLAVYLHWGIERDEYPQDYQTQIAGDCIAAGADLIVGAHPHCLQGITYIDGKPVFYSLGNFVFNQTIERTAVLKVTVSDDGAVTYRLLAAYASNGKTALMEDADAAELYEYMNELSNGAAADDNGVVSQAD